MNPQNILWLVVLTVTAGLLQSSLAFLPLTSTPRQAARMDASAKKDGIREGWNVEHLIHNAKEIHEETEAEILESEQAAIWDAHDSSDPGMEAVAELRAVMMAQEYAHYRHDLALHSEKAETTKSKKWNEQHLIHGALEIHEETEDEWRESERMAAFDAHDCSDPGMEAAAEERAVMLAQEIAHTLHQDAVRKSIENGLKNV